MRSRYAVFLVGVGLLSTVGLWVAVTPMFWSPGSPTVATPLPIPTLETGGVVRSHTPPPVTEEQTYPPPEPLPSPPGKERGGANCTAAAVTLAETKHQYVCAYMHDSRPASPRAGCEVQCPDRHPCTILTDPSRHDLKTADGVIYHPGRNLPVTRGHAKQVGIMWYGESAEKHPEKYTAGYLARYDAHVVFKSWSKYRFSWTQRFAPEFHAIEKAGGKWVQWSKRRSAVAVVSNCKYHTTNRTAVMEELDRELVRLSGGKERLYMFGKCHPGRARDSVAKEHPHCKARSEKDKYKEKMCVLQQYRYVIAMDNSRDEDYVTEKVYHALLAGAVPIFDGAANIDEYIPTPHSVLKVREYPSLANVAKSILANRERPPDELGWATAPSSWSTAFRRNLDLPNPACTICHDIRCGTLKPRNV